MIADHKLVYGALTAALTLAYVAGVVVLQALFRVYTGGESQLAAVASTLAIAVLLNHPRQRIQTSINDGLRRRNPRRGPPQRRSNPATQPTGLGTSRC